jgi:hypothetical protein
VADAGGTTRVFPPFPQKTNLPISRERHWSHDNSDEDDDDKAKGLPDCFPAEITERRVERHATRPDVVSLSVALFPPLLGGCDFSLPRAREKTAGTLSAAGQCQGPPPAIIGLFTRKLAGPLSAKQNATRAAR